jgi:DHA2 family multidrug resistance protein
MILGLGLYGALFAIPVFAQTMLHYTAMQTGLLLLPSAIASAFCMVISSQVVKRFDARLVIAFGAIMLSVTMFYLAGINPDTSEESLFWPLIWRGVGTVFMFLPLTMATISSIPKKDIASATGFFNLTRQIGGSIGIAILTTLLAQRENFHRSVLTEHVSLYDPLVRGRLTMMAQALQSRGIDPVSAKNKALGMVDGMINMHAAVMSYGDIFWLVGIIFIFSLGLLFFLGKGSQVELPADAH